jgi:predicted Zn-dependent protease
MVESFTVLVGCWESRVGQRVALAAGHSIDAIEFYVVNDQYIYAYAYPLTHIVAISKGMYDDFRNDDELASILAHEVAHICMDGKTGHLPTTLEESRAHEFNADQLAVEFVTRAGFDPRRFMQCLWRYMGYKFLGGDGFYHDKDSTHPSTVHRIRAVNRLIDSPIS